MIGRYGTALRPYVHKRLEEIRQADILVGIPCYNSEATIETAPSSVDAAIQAADRLMYAAKNGGKSDAVFEQYGNPVRRSIGEDHGTSPAAVASTRRPVVTSTLTSTEAQR